MAAPRLVSVLSDLIHGRGDAAPRLSGGLILQFKEAETVVDDNRLACYRIGKGPDENEVATVEKYLTKLLPLGTEIFRRRTSFPYLGSDGLERNGMVLVWKTAVPQQAELLDTAPPARPGAFEGM